MKNYDVTVIGSGPGGYVCAIRCAQLGMKTAIIEKYKTLGGTCLNVGCIPSKALLDSSEHYHQAKEKFSAHGILVDNLRIDLKKMIERKNEVVSQTCAGVDYLMKKNKIDVYCGTGFFENKNTISIRKEDDSVEKISTKNAVIATGSKPTVLPFIPVDKERIITSTEALNLQEVPKHMILIGGGVIGTELGSVYARLGAKVSVVELLDRIVPPFDKVMSKELQKSLKKMGMEFYLKHKVTKVERDGDNVKVYADKDGKEVILEGDYCLVAIGRSPYTKGLNLEEIGVATEKGRIAVNDHLQTSIDNIYAIGDVIDGPMLAHKAEEEGIFVAELLDGQKPHINHLTIPNVVYTWPEVASVGYTEEQVKEQNRAYNVGSFPFKASGRARASMDLEGLVKVICDKETDEILGIHIIGPRAADMIAEGVLAMEYKASAEDIARICHAHPTFTEAFKEAALAATGNRALHIQIIKKRCSYGCD